MRSKITLPYLTLLLVSMAIFSCKKETITNIIPAAPFAMAGTNQNEVEEFRVTLNADSLRPGQNGKWTIESGLIEKDLVYFSNDTKPDSKFNGMPGEKYVLIWTVSQKSKNISTSKVNISFKALKATITNQSPENKTKFYFSANSYQKGLWTIQGKYARLINTILGGTVTPAQNSPSILFQGYAHSKYTLTWTTFYGSKSASTSIDLFTGDYLESEAVSDLQLNADSERLTYQNGHITTLDLHASGIAWILEDTLQFPALQSLKYLKTLDLSGSSVKKFPTVIGDQYPDIESITIESTAINEIPNNIGKLKKLKRFIMGHGLYGVKIHSLPEGFGNLESLEYFVANNSGLRFFPFSFSKLKNLKYLECYLNPLEGLPYDVGNMTKLETVMVNATDPMPASITKLSKLRRLYYNSTAAYDGLPSDFGKLSSLDTMVLECKYTSLPASIGDLNLKVLQIKASNITVLPETMGNMRNLEVLFLAGKFKALPESISKLSRLDNLLLQSRELEQLPQAIGDLKSLTYLNADWGKLKTLPASFGGLIALKEARIESNELEALPASLFDLPGITTLSISNNKLTRIPDEFAKLAKTLKTLNIFSNPFPVSDGVKLKKLLPNTLVNIGY